MVEIDDSAEEFVKYADGSYDIPIGKRSLAAERGGRLIVCGKEDSGVLYVVLASPKKNSDPITAGTLNLYLNKFTAINVFRDMKVRYQPFSKIDPAQQKIIKDVLK